MVPIDHIRKSLLNPSSSQKANQRMAWLFLYPLGNCAVEDLVCIGILVLDLASNWYLWESRITHNCFLKWKTQVLSYKIIDLFCLWYSNHPCKLAWKIWAGLYRVGHRQISIFIKFGVWSHHSGEVHDLVAAAHAIAKQQVALCLLSFALLWFSSYSFIVSFQVSFAGSPLSCFSALSHLPSLHWPGTHFWGFSPHSDADGINSSFSA